MTSQQDRNARRLNDAKAALAHVKALHEAALMQTTVRTKDGGTGHEADIARLEAEVAEREAKAA